MFDELPDTWTLAGAVIIVVAGLYVLRRETRLKHRQSPVTATAPSARFWSP